MELMSSSVGKIATALAEAQAKMSNAVKDSKNPFFKSNYADINSVREACLPALNAVGISVWQPTVYFEGKKFVKTLFLHTSGEFLAGLTEIVFAKELDPQAQIAGTTYARRGGLQSMANLGVEDDDGNTAAGKQSVRSQVSNTQSVVGNGNVQISSTEPAGSKIEFPKSTATATVIAKVDIAKPSGDKSFRKAKPAAQEEL